MFDSRGGGGGGGGGGGEGGGDFDIKVTGLIVVPFRG